MEQPTETAPKKEAHIDVYSVITDKIIAQLHKDIVPWRKPWTSAGVPRNLISGDAYRGINVMLLAMEGYEQNLFLTFQQAQEIKAKVRRGEKGHTVVYWNAAEQADKQEGETEVSDDKKKKTVLRYYTVFNISQCENIPERYLPAERGEAKEIPSCEAIVSGMPQCPTIKYKEQQAYYNPLEDFVNMPKRKSFTSDASYYSTLFHELVHSTGHHSRLGRMGLVQMSEFGGELYSQEELVAEIGTCYLQFYAGIPQEFEQSAAYIQGWLARLRKDKRFIFTAAKDAQKAVDLILHIKDAKEDAEQNDA